MVKLEKVTSAGTLSGVYVPEFEAVADAFVHNFEVNGEVGASVCVTRDGDTVVDLWGGTADAKTESPWQEDTLCVVFSSTKGAVALAAHTLVASGELQLDAPVKRYWPGFATNGKEDATVRMMLDHSVGVPAMREKLKDKGCCDWEYMVERLEQEAPFWRPGTRNGYHMANFGWTVGELIRRTAGQSLGAYFREAIAGPTGAECWIGLPEAMEPRVAPMIPFKPVRGAPLSAFTQALVSDAKSIPSLAYYNQGGFNPNSRDCRAAEIGGAGAVANGRGLAKIYAPFACGGELGGRRFVDADTLAAMGEVAVATHEDATLMLPTRFALGFMKSMDNRNAPGVDRSSVILGSAAFGHVGAGGSIGFADPAARMSFGYAMNRMGPGILMNERGQSLVDAAYRAMGYASNTSGVWRRG
ncbi:MAG: beta-lactamase family protein [Pseudomonadales bacterium]|nr:beta-lactamase family protein [Pseudomonadales bacterium]MCP5185298.1 beta-lactamase family protein [Pseudomonadales bacterium]